VPQYKSAIEDINIETRSGSVTQWTLTPPHFTESLSGHARSTFVEIQMTAKLNIFACKPQPVCCWDIVQFTAGRSKHFLFQYLLEW